MKPWRKQCWCIPPKASAELVCAMEDVLEVYHREFDEDTVLMCMDEISEQRKRLFYPLLNDIGRFVWVCRW